MLLTAAAGADCAILRFYPASGRLDFLPRTRAHLDAAHRYTIAGFTVRQKLGGTLTAADQSGLDQSLLRHLSAFRQSCQIVESDDLMLYTKDIREPALWHTAGDRHLAALELGLAAAGTVMARTGFDTLMALAGSLTGARARTTAESLAIPMRPRSWNKVVQPDPLYLRRIARATGSALCFG